ncbi:MAG: hypothetical protein Q8939_06900 [Bacteroidota bacterium]|nr:hypothetical protein [Bacteroidota bacterium]
MNAVQTNKNPLLSAISIFLLGLFSVCGASAVAQAIKILSIENAYLLARTNYPLIRQKDLTSLICSVACIHPLKACLNGLSSLPG